MSGRCGGKFLPVAVLVIGDLLVLGLVLAASVLLRGWLAQWFPIEIAPRVYAGALAGVLLLPLAYGYAGLYPGYGCVGVERLQMRVTVTLTCFAAMILFDYLAQDGKWSRGILLAAGLLATIALPIWDCLALALLIRLKAWGEPAVVLGPPERRAEVMTALREHPQLGWLPAAEVRPDDPPLAEADLALVALDDSMGILPDWAGTLPYRRVVLVPASAHGLQSLWISPRDLGGSLGLEMRRNLLMPRIQIFKRIMDLGLGGLLLLTAAPVIATASAAVFLLSPGSLFYGQLRQGRHGQPFRMWKIRTMVPGAEAMLDELLNRDPQARAEWESSMKLRRDPRQIPLIGPFLRRFSIDELPQLWNVLTGEMSLVGPRPLPDYHMERLDPAMRALRLKVRPGITGLWQVSGRSGTDIAHMQSLDAYYVRNWSLWIDIHVLGRTILAVLGGRGAW